MATTENKVIGWDDEIQNDGEYGDPAGGELPV